MHRKFTDEQEREICKQYLDEKISTVILAKRWGCTDITIGHVIIRNEYTLRTRSEALKGRKVWNKGLTKEINIKLARSEETKRKISKNNSRYWLGKQRPEESKQKMSKSHMGLIPANKGKSLSEESKQKMRDRKIGMYIGKKNPFYGKHHSEETKQKIREKTLLQHQNHHGPFKDTKPELKMKDILNDLNISFEHQIRLEHCLFDFRLLNTNILIEVDGDYFHANPKMFKKLNKMQLKMKQRDIKHDKIAKENNFILLRFWENDILNNEEIVKDKLRSINA